MAEILVQEYGYTRLRFAEPLKGMIHKLLSSYMGIWPHIALEAVDGPYKDQPMPEWFNLTPRRMMQTLGSEWGRDCLHPQLWCEILKRRALTEIGDGRRVVVDDVRFENEYRTILSISGARMVQVIRPDVMAEQTHASEGNLDDHRFDFELWNNGTLEDLDTKVRQMLPYLEYTPEKETFDDVIRRFSP